jgi:hypothetical protein
MVFQFQLHSGNVPGEKTIMSYNQSFFLCVPLGTLLILSGRHHCFFLAHLKILELILLDRTQPVWSVVVVFQEGSVQLSQFLCTGQISGKTQKHTESVAY